MEVSNKLSYQIIPEKGLIIDSWQGDLTKEDMIAAKNAQSRNSEYDSNFSCISDFRNAKLAFSFVSAKAGFTCFSKDSCNAPSFVEW